MGNLGGAEILVILLVALIVLGPTKLPPAVRQIGKFMGEIRRIGQGFQQELRDAAKPLQEATAELKAADKNLRETTQKPLKEMTDTLKAADPRKVIAPPPATKDKATGKGAETMPSGKDGAASGPVSWGAAAASLSAPPAASGEDADSAAAPGAGEPDADVSGSAAPSSDVLEVSAGESGADSSESEEQDAASRADDAA